LRVYFLAVFLWTPLLCQEDETLLIDLDRNPIMLQVVAVDQPHIAPLKMPERFRLEVVYFMTPGDAEGAPLLGPKDYWIRSQDAKVWLEDGVVRIVSPLDAESKAEIEISEDQELFLEWLVTHDIQHVRMDLT